jgi:hypothetical protein
MEMGNVVTCRRRRFHRLVRRGGIPLARRLGYRILRSRLSGDLKLVDDLTYLLETRRIMEPC